MDLQSRLILNREEFMEDEAFNVCCGTYNVNGKYPDESLRPWLADLHRSFVAKSGEVDVYAIGFQEIVDLTTSSFILKTDWDKKEASWVDAVREVIENIDLYSPIDPDENNNSEDPVSGQAKAKRKYRLLRKERMYGVMLLVFVDEKLPVSSDSGAQVPMGVLGTLGNKGSVGVSFKLYETRLCFICSHFASDTEKVEKRNSDFRNTVKNLMFPGSSGRILTIEEHDMVFWFGDFNYRIDRLSLQETLNKIHANDAAFLLKYDQLSIERSNKRVFANFIEGPVKFRPTYKYVIKTDRYEKETLNMNATLSDSPTSDSNSSFETKSTSSTLDPPSSRHGSSRSGASSPTSPNAPSGKVKLPSWTDRVLWRSNDASRVKQLKYFCANTITISDHKPVCALFEVQIPKINMTKLLQTYEQMNLEEDRRVNEEIPHITVDRNDLNFGDSCYYYASNTLEIVVKNESNITKANVSAMFRDESIASMIDDEADAGLETSSSTDAAEWLDKRTHHQTHSIKLNPSQWLIISPTHRENVGPGEQFTVELTLNFNKHILEKLDKNTHDNLELRDFVIIRCTSGNHIFVSVSCSYKPTIIGLSLKALSILGNTSFDEFKKTSLFDVQGDITKYENELDTIWTSKFNSLNWEKTAVSQRVSGQSSFFGNVVAHPRKGSSTKIPFEKLPTKKKSSSFSVQKSVASTSTPASKLDAYTKCLTSLNTEIKQNDRYFRNDLSSEYVFLLDYMIEKAVKELSYLENVEAQTGEQDEVYGLEKDKSVEEIKNEMLAHLSSRNFKEIEKADYEMELLCELLYDLLYALPQPLIPLRYFDFCTFANAGYEDLVKLLHYLPKSHVRLFELIVKFLQIFLKCLTSCDSNFDCLLANAIFQIDQRPVSRSLTSSQSSFKSSSFPRSRSNTNDLFQRSQSSLDSENSASNRHSFVKEATYNFVHKFVLNHHKFLTIP